MQIAWMVLGLYFALSGDINNAISCFVMNKLFQLEESIQPV
jgi:hypothetical protein